MSAVSSFNRGRDRFYEVEGHDKELPSITTFLSAIAKPALTNWAAKTERALIVGIAKEVFAQQYPHEEAPPFSGLLDARLKQTKYACNTRLEEAGEIGTALHARIEWELKNELMQSGIGDPPAVAKEAGWAFDAWQNWRKQTNFKPLMVEQKVYSVKHGFAGTTDVIGKIGDLVVVGDWKTSSGIYAEHLIQVSAYREALREMGHYTDVPVGGVIVKLPKKADDKKFKATTLTPAEMDEHFKTFLAVRDLWVALKKFEGDKRYR